MASRARRGILEMMGTQVLKDRRVRAGTVDFLVEMGKRASQATKESRGREENVARLESKETGGLRGPLAPGETEGYRGYLVQMAMSGLRVSWGKKGSGDFLGHLESKEKLGLGFLDPRVMWGSRGDWGLQGHLA